MSDSPPLLLTKEQSWANRSRRSLKKGDITDLLVMLANRSQKRAICLKKFLFLVVVDSFSLLSPFFMSKSESVPSLFAPSLFFTSKSFFRSQKTSNSLEKPMSEFPTLLTGELLGPTENWRWDHLDLLEVIWWDEPNSGSCCFRLFKWLHIGSKSN